MKLATLSLGDIDIILVDRPPTEQYVNAIGGSIAIQIHEGRIFRNNYGAWKEVGPENLNENSMLSLYKFREDSILFTQEIQGTHFKIESNEDLNLYLFEYNSLVGLLSLPAIVEKIPDQHIVCKGKSNYNLENFFQKDLYENSFLKMIREPQVHQIEVDPSGEFFYLIGERFYKFYFDELFDFNKVRKTYESLSIGFSPEEKKCFAFSKNREFLYVVKRPESFLNMVYFPDQKNISNGYIIGSYPLHYIDNNIVSIYISENGERIFCVGADNNAVYELILNTPFHITNGIQEVKTYPFQDRMSINGASISDNGKNIFILDEANNLLLDYGLKQPFDFSFMELINAMDFNNFSVKNPRMVSLLKTSKNVQNVDYLNRYILYIMGDGPKHSNYTCEGMFRFLEPREGFIVTPLNVKYI